MQANVLKLIGARELGDQAEFRDPCLSFVLTEVICSFCNKIRDFDLCRDKVI